MPHTRQPLRMDVVVVLSSLSGVAASALVLFAVADLTKAGPPFWPPPSPDSWQSRLFTVLFRVMVYVVVAASAVDLAEGLRVGAGTLTLAALLLFCGFGIAFLATYQLGWEQAFGADQELRTDGIFAFSRNPIYVATFLGLSGWGLILPRTEIVLVLGLWAVMYLIAVPLEEQALRAA